MACPANSIRYNQTLCACQPGYLLNRATNSCTLFADTGAILTDSGVEYYSFSLPDTIFSFDSIKKLTRSQAIFLEVTLVMLVSWLVFCCLLRFVDVGDGRSVWFRLRWWISRLDVSFATKHWLDDQKAVMKRKTELGGTFSIGSWILFIGLFSALLYQIITRRTFEVHNVRATNAPDLASFVNDIEFNITAVSSMSCLNLRGLGTVVTGNPGSVDYRISPLADFVNYGCQNTTAGPTVTFKCTSCRLNRDYMYISWHFIDLPNSPAEAVGFQFNLTIKDHPNRKHTSFVSGTLKNGSSFNDRPVTFRGVETSILKFNLFPKMYHNLHDLKLIQPLFHEFLPGSFVRETNQLQASLERSSTGTVNTTLCINYLSSYVIEIRKQSIMSPVSFLADLGGLYCISFGIFFFLLAQCEFRIKRLRNEDSILRKIRNQRKAQEHWKKLRCYVKYTWGCNAVELDNSKSAIRGSSFGSFMVPLRSGNASSKKQMILSKTEHIDFNKKKLSVPSKKHSMHEPQIQEVRSSIAGTASEKESPTLLQERHLKSLNCEEFDSSPEGKQHSIKLCKRAVSQLHDDTVPLPPPLEARVGEVSDIEKNLQNLYDYNIMLREKLVATRSLLHDIAQNSNTKGHDYL